MERLKIIGEVILLEQGLFTVKKIARETGLLMLSCMLVKGEEDGAIMGLEAFGFERAAELPDYIMDPEGNVFDAVLLIKRLEE